MELSKESQTSTNTSEVKESVEVRNTCNRSFLLSIRYIAVSYNFVSTTSLLSKFRNQTHVTACSTRKKQGSTRGCPCRGDN